MNEHSIEHRKRAVIAALESSLGIVTTACQKVGVGRTQFYNWMKSDEDFARQVKDIENIAFDFVESQLFRQIQENNVQATMFYLRTKGKNRGYSERTEITGLNGEPLQPMQIILPSRPDEDA